MTARLPIIPVLEYYGARDLSEQPGNQKIKCVFHDDGQASASVNTEKGLFQCFTCQTQGDAIALIRDQEGLEYPGAVRFAEETLGLDDAGVRERAAVPERRTSLRVSSRGQGAKRGNARKVSRRLR